MILQLSIGRFLSSPAHETGGARTTIKNTIALPKNFRRSPNRRTKSGAKRSPAPNLFWCRKRRSRGKEFLPACSAALRAAWDGKRQRILRQQKGKAEKFSSLKEKLKKRGAHQKMNGKFFCFARRQANAAAGRVPCLAGRQVCPSGRRIKSSSGVQQLRP